MGNSKGRLASSLPRIDAEGAGQVHSAHLPPWHPGHPGPNRPAEGNRRAPRVLEPAGARSHHSVLLRRLGFSGHNATPADVHVARISARRTDLHLSVAEKMIGGSGFIRGLAGNPQYVRPNGEVVTDPSQMRCDCLGFLEHTERVYQRVRRQVLYVTSYGDAGTNREYVGYVSEGGPRLLLCRRDEEARWSQGYCYYALGVEQDGTPWSGRVRFALAADGRHVLDESGEDLTPRLRLLLTGPPLVWEGRPLRPETSAPRWAADLRHLLAMLACTLPTGARTLLWEGLLMDEDNAHLLRAAASGEPLALPLTWPSPEGIAPLPSSAIDSLVANAQAHGYRLVPARSVSAPGDLAVDDHRAVICFKPGIYPHNLLGIDRARGTWINIQVGGISTLSGCTISEAAQLLAEAGADHAIGLDQGADPQFLVQRGHGFYYKPSFNYRSRVSAALVWTASLAVTGQCEAEERQVAAG